MNLSVSKIVKQVGDFYKKLTKRTKIIIFTSLGIILGVAVIISLIMNNNKYTILYNGLSASESTEILSLLEGMEVDVKVEDNGSILVPKDKEAAIKMQLASEGYPKSTLDYDIFINQSDLFTTDYEKKKLLIFQLQNRLQDSIRTVEGIEDCIVTLSIPDDNSYVLKDEVVDITASVMLKIYRNTELQTKQIKGIERLVANSVPGLTNDKVVIVGNDGVQLNKGQTDSELDGAGIKIETVNLINEVYERKIKDFLKPVLGENGVSVSVNVKVNFEQTSTQETIYTPVIGEDGIISWVERSNSSENTNNPGGTAGTGNNTDVPTYEETSADKDDETYKEDHFSAEYLVNQLVKVIQDNGGNIEDMTVAVIINAKELPENKMLEYRNLVAKSAGIDEEKIVISNAEFKSADLPQFPEPGDQNAPIFLGLGKIDLIIISGATLLLIIFVTVIIIMLKKKKKAKIEELLKQSGVDQEETSGIDMPGEIVPNETREQALKRQIKEYTSKNPETVAQLLRVWIKEDENS